LLICHTSAVSRLLPSSGIQQWQYYTLIFKTPKFLFFLSIMDKSKKQCK